MSYLFRSCVPRNPRCAPRLSRTNRLLPQDDTVLVWPQVRRPAYTVSPLVEWRDQDSSSETGYVSIAVGPRPLCPSYDTLSCCVPKDTSIQRPSLPSLETETVSNPCQASDQADRNTSDKGHGSAGSEGSALVLTRQWGDRSHVPLGGPVLLLRALVVRGSFEKGGEWHADTF